MELEEAAHGSLAQVRISLVTHNAEGGLSQQQPPPAAASDWGYLANLRSVAEAEPQSVGGTRAAGATAVLESLREERYGGGPTAKGLRIFFLYLDRRRGRKHWAARFLFPFGRG